MTYGGAVTALRERRGDLLIAEPPVEEGDIVVGPVLFSERRALVVPATDPLAKRETVSLEDLAQLPLITAAGVSEAWRQEFFPTHTPGGRPIEHGPTAGGAGAEPSSAGRKSRPASLPAAPWNATCSDTGTRNLLRRTGNGEVLTLASSGAANNGPSLRPG